MYYIFYFLAGIVLIILQTTVFPRFLIFKNFYDIFIPFVIYISVFRSFWEGLGFIFCFGWIIDSLFGGPFGLHISVYFWMHIIIKWTIEFFDFQNFIVLFMLVFLSVLIENFIFFLTVSILKESFLLLEDYVTIFLNQIIWASVSGVFFIFVFKYIHQGFDSLCNLLILENKEED